MNQATKPRIAYREVLIGILAGLDEHEDPDMEEVMYGFLDDLKEADPFDVALAGFELAARLTAELGQWTGNSRAETLKELAAAVATDPIP